MTSNRWAVLLTFLACILTFAAVDLWAALSHEKGDTLSEMTLQVTQQIPVAVPLFIGLAVGFVLGHLLWPQRARKNG